MNKIGFYKNESENPHKNLRISSIRSDNSYKKVIRPILEAQFQFVFEGTKKL